MLRSMTGFGKATFEFGSKHFTIEIKSLNSKQADVFAKIPSYLKEKEIEIRNLASSKLERGKIEVVLYYEMLETENKNKLNKAIIIDYYKQFKSIADELNMDDDVSLLTNMLRFPDVLKIERPELDENEWDTLKNGLNEALQNLIDYRVQEGDVLENDISKRIYNINNLLSEVRLFETSRIDKIKNRIRNNLNEFVGEDKIDENRFEQELIYFLEKFDITEEKVRLDSNCSYFLDTINEEGPVGKKLGFIAQEIGREINTLGSKANDADIQKIVVRMKDELEKIKEQLMNVL